MILIVDRWPSSRYAESSAEMAALVDDVMNELESGKGEANAAPIAHLSFAPDRQAMAGTGWRPDNILQVSVSPGSGYGALIWSVTPDRPGFPRDEIDEFIWVSDNPGPPDFDPKVLADPGLPSYFDRRSALKWSQIRAVLHEFCRGGTGDRPGGTDWVHGDYDGRRLEGQEDRGSEAGPPGAGDFAGDFDDPWA